MTKECHFDTTDANSLWMNSHRKIVTRNRARSTAGRIKECHFDTTDANSLYKSKSPILRNGYSRGQVLHNGESK
jgi:hypothetical protein